MKKTNKVRRVAVIGAGTMGRGIAKVCAIHNCDVVPIDVSDDTLRVLFRDNKVERIAL